ncbi:Hypothetical predicted protein [Mytilus galloprovincialis]|uniref:C-type lectin domain-containing protein n=1 Tax=Mytilus galloprovincialis TaxID=29158 RepID=A0A8B6F1X9_MYTGA|nr:Hypothetical predicted protein [Mytilus galloprovincialis]
MEVYSLSVCIWYFILAFGYTNGECPLGWIHFGESCYLFSTEHLNWYFAQGSCRGHDARLAEVTTKAQADFLTDLALRFNRIDNYWLGGRDDVKEGIWIWSTTDMAFNYTSWGPGEPNGNTNANCLCLYHNLKYKWDDNVCTASFSFVCEKIYHDTDEIIG